MHIIKNAKKETFSDPVKIEIECVIFKQIITHFERNNFCKVQNILQNKNMCDDNSLIIADVQQLPKCTSTFTSKGSGSSSWIDHCIVNDSLCGSTCVPYGAGPSDYLTLLMNIEIQLIHASSTTVKNRVPHVKWMKLTESQKYNYKNYVYQMISQSEWQYCEENGCQNREHFEGIKQKTEMLINILKKAACKLTAVQCKQKVKSKCVNGWNELVKPYYDDYRNSFLNWRSNVSKDYYLFRVMSEKRKAFRKALCRCRRDKQKRESDELASSYEGKNFVEFWEKIKRHDNQKESLAMEVDGVNGVVQIAEHRAKVYEKLFNTAQSTKYENS